MKLFFYYLLVLPFVGWAQGQPIAKAVELAKQKTIAGNKSISLTTDLFTFNGTEKAITNALSTDKAIYKLTLNPDVLSRIRQDRFEYLEISVPTTNGSVQLALVPFNIFAPGFLVETGAPTPTVSFDPSKVICYQGIANGNRNSLVALTIYGNEIMGIISDSTGNRVLAHNPDKSALATEYAFYDERAVMQEINPFGCATADSPLGQVKSRNPVRNKEVVENTSTSNRCIRYVGIYAEVDNRLYQYYGNNTMAQITFLFNQVFAIYNQEGMHVRLSGLKIWNIPDPYNFSSSGANQNEWDQYAAYWNARSNNFPGQLAHLLTRGVSDSDVGAGGIADLRGLWDKNFAYAITTLNRSTTFETYPDYSRGVKVVTHEIGHNLGAHHTHWCGWEGGALDNCAPSEPYQGRSCPDGPALPAYGGSIMSYCDSRNVAPIYFPAGFGTQPDQNQIGDFLRTEVGNASINFSITTYDGSLPSVASGSWNAGSTWACGLTSSTVYDVTVTNSTSVQLNNNGATKSLDLQGTLDLSTTGTVINITNN